MSTRTYYSPGGRISRAEARRRFAAAQVAAAEVKVPTSIDLRLAANAASDLAPRIAEAVTAFVAGTLAHSTLSGEERKRKHATHLKYLALYGVERNLPLSAEGLLTTEVIDSYIRQLDASDTLRAQRRTRLLNLATHVNPGPTTPARLAPIGYIANKPAYTPDEAVVIRRLALEQPTARRGRNLAAVVGVTAGCGGTSPDLRHLRTSQVRRTPTGIYVTFTDPARTVVCRAFWEPVLDRAMVDADPGGLFYGEREDRRNRGARAVSNAELLDEPRIEVARLRATWLADLMTDPVPLAVILKASGLKTARTLAELMPHLDPWMRHKGLTGADVAMGEQQ
jgi:hypothetical protein